MIILFLFVSCYEKNVVGKRTKEYKKIVACASVLLLSVLHCLRSLLQMRGNSYPRYS